MASWLHKIYEKTKMELSTLLNSSVKFMFHIIKGAKTAMFQSYHSMAVILFLQD